MKKSDSYFELLLQAIEDLSPSKIAGFACQNQDQGYPLTDSQIPFPDSWGVVHES